MWILLLVGGIVMLLQNSTEVQLDRRYFFIGSAVMLLTAGAVFAPAFWGFSALVAVPILYFAERWYARQWRQPRLWWYRFFQTNHAT